MTTKTKPSTYLDILEELEKGATKGPWTVRKYESGWDWDPPLSAGIKYTDAMEEADARLIAFLRNTAEEVRAVVEAAWQEDEGLGETRTRRALDALDARSREVSEIRRLREDSEGPE